MAGIRPPDNAASPHRRNRLKASNVHYLFSVRNMFFSWILPISAIPQPFLERIRLPHVRAREAHAFRTATGGIFSLKKLHEYLQHAAECRNMARTASPAHRQHLEQMAETWEQLAEARKRKLEKNDQTLVGDYPAAD